ncbi:DUF4044 domain-containing protein [Clostridium sp. MSJ-8]|nr:DUF4044 domain-containing protein [Clostridium sp. MSJ-8]MBU5488649.1 DUF4044 domain-containing protein [Clostridium sp. MSJ-8]
MKKSTRNKMQIAMAIFLVVMMILSLIPVIF